MLFLCLVFKDEHEFKSYLSGQNIQIKLAQTILKFSLCCSLSDNFLFWSDFICTIVYLPAYGNFYILILIKLRLFLNTACIKPKLPQKYIIFLSIVSYFSYILFSIKKTFFYLFLILKIFSLMDYTQKYLSRSSKNEIPTFILHIGKIKVDGSICKRCILISEQNIIQKVTFLFLF